MRDCAIGMRDCAIGMGSYFLNLNSHNKTKAPEEALCPKVETRGVDVSKMVPHSKMEVIGGEA